MTMSTVAFCCCLAKATNVNRREHLGGGSVYGNKLFLQTTGYSVQLSYSSQQRVRCRELVNTVMNLPVPRETFLHNLSNYQLVREAVLRGLSLNKEKDFRLSASYTEHFRINNELWAYLLLSSSLSLSLLHFKLLLRTHTSRPSIVHKVNFSGAFET